MNVIAITMIYLWGHSFMCFPILDDLGHGINACEHIATNAADAAVDYLYALMSECNVSLKGNPEFVYELVSEQSHDRSM